MKRSDILELENLCNRISDASVNLKSDSSKEAVDIALDELEDYCGLVLEKIEEVRDER